VGVLFTFLFFFGQSPISPSLIRNNPSPQSTSENSGTTDSSTGLSNDEIERILEEAKRPFKSADEFDSLRDHLAYLYPYKGPSSTKFPAYIWQTWKYTPAMGEFDERFRMTEASWTEQHPDYVHEVTLNNNPN
jgi:alpha 1,6-mannosyltransferase